MYIIVCEVIPGVLVDGIEDFEEAKKIARRKAEEIWNEQHVSLYCMVKDETYYSYYAVRYTPADGGTFHVPEDYYLSMGA